MGTPNQSAVYAHIGRGNAYFQKGAFDQAIADYTEAITLKTGVAGAYFNRGISRLCEQEYRKAIADLTTARDMGFDIVAAFHKDYKGIEVFETKFGVKVPGDIVAMLRGSSH